MIEQPIDRQLSPPERHADLHQLQAASATKVFFPVGAELLSEHLAGLPQFANLRICFSDRPT